MNSFSSRAVTITSSDGASFFRKGAAAALLAMEKPADAGVAIQVPLVNGETLAAVAEWCKKHASTATKAELESWDAAFVEDQASPELWGAARFLCIDELADLIMSKLVVGMKRPQTAAKDIAETSTAERNEEALDGAKRQKK